MKDIVWKDPKQMGLFFDVIAILDRAVEEGGGEVTVRPAAGKTAHGAAVYWRQRANKIRKAYREANSGKSRWDFFKFDVPPDDSGRVLIGFNIGGNATFVGADTASPSQATFIPPDEDAI